MWIPKLAMLALMAVALSSGSNAPAAAAPRISVPDGEEPAMQRNWQLYTEQRDIPAQSPLNKTVASEILATRAALAQAIASGDAGAVETFFAPDYQLTLGDSVMTNDSKDRALWLSLGNRPFETFPMLTYSVRALDANTAVLTAVLKITQGGSVVGPSHGQRLVHGLIRATYVFTRSGPHDHHQRWRLAAAQALRLQADPPPSLWCVIKDPRCDTEGRPDSGLATVVAASPAEAPAPPIMVASGAEERMYGEWKRYAEENDRPTQSASQTRIGAEIMAVRGAMADAIAAHDARTLQKYFADDYHVTLGNSTMVTKADRVAWLAAGNPTFETAPILTYSVRELDADNAVLLAVVKYTQGGPKIGPSNGQPVTYGLIRGLYVFTKSRPSAGYAGWKLVTAQALRLLAAPPPSLWCIIKDRRCFATVAPQSPSQAR